MENFDFFVLLFIIGLSSFLLLSRKRKWSSNIFKFGITGVLFAIGILGLNTGIFEELTNGSQTIFKLSQIPLFIMIAEAFFRRISYKIHNRDFILNMKGSEELVSGKTNPDMKASDYIFSTILIILIFTLPIFYGF